jgi:hypothetical protein
VIVKKGNKFLVMDSKGQKVLGTHDSKTSAEKQLTAIHISQQKNESRKLKFSDFLFETSAHTLEYHEKLNPKFWTGNKLKSEVKDKLIEIGKVWCDWAEIPKKAIKDFLFVGGNANFNYTQFSDIDLHILIDMDLLDDCPGLLDDYLKDKRDLWMLTHDISIYGNDVEVSAQDLSHEFPEDQGVYSLLDDKWLSEPSYKEIDIDDPHVSDKVSKYMKHVDDLINSNADISSLEKLKDKIKDMRSSGIKQGGEYSVENLIFKELRNSGYIQKIKDYIKSRQDKDLSL